MSEIEPVSAAIQKIFNKFNEDYQKKILRNSIFIHWNEIANIYAKDIVPLKIVDDTLILYSENSSAKNNLKYIAKDIIDSVNEKIGGGKKIFNKIDFAKTFEKPTTPIKITEQKKSVQIDISKIELSAEEISDCEKNAAEIKNSEIKKIAFESFVNKKKVDKWKIQNGWHECKICKMLCEPEKNICEICKIVERNKMRREIRKIFCTQPEIKFTDVLQKIKKNYPDIAEEISLQTVESERSALIGELAAQIPSGDTKSDAAKLLIRIYRGVSGKELNDAVINRTIKRLKFNLVQN